MATGQEIRSSGFFLDSGKNRRLRLFRNPEDGRTILWDSETGVIYRNDLSFNQNDIYLLVMELAMILKESLANPNAKRISELIATLNNFPKPSVNKEL